MPVNKSTANSYGNGSSTQYRQTFYFHKRSRKHKGESFNISNNLQINPGRSTSFNNNDVINYQHAYLTDSLRRRSSRTNTNVSGNIDLSYRYPVTKKLTLDITTSNAYNKSSDQLFTYDIKTNRFDSLLTNQSSDLKRDQWTENVKPGLTYQLGKNTQIIAGLNTQWQQIANNFSSSRLNQNYFFLLPTIRFETDQLSISYDRNVNQPGISSLQPITIVYSPLYTFTGNPNLRPAINDSYNLNYRLYTTQSQISVWLYSSVYRQKNMSINQQTIRSDGSQTVTVVNRDGRPGYNMNIGFNKRFRKMKDWQIFFSSSVYGYYNQNLNLLNNAEGWQNTFNRGIYENIFLDWKEKMTLNIGAGYSISDTKYNYDDFRKVHAGNFNLNNSLVVRPLRQLTWETKQDFYYNTQIAPGLKKGVNVISSSVAMRMFKKDRGELKFTVYDLFNQNVSIYRTTGTNSINDVQNNTLNRYFLVSYSIKFNKLSTK